MDESQPEDEKVQVRVVAVVVVMRMKVRKKLGRERQCIVSVLVGFGEGFS
jgi:hypothetical protein